MAAKKKAAPHRPSLRNPGSPHAKPAAKKRAAPKKNPGRPAAKRRITRRANPTGGTNLLLFSIGGVVAVKAFDLAVKYLVPSLAAPITIIGMGAAAFGISSYGGKYFGKWADIIAVGLGLMAAARAWDAYVNPLLPAQLQVSGGPQVVATQPLVDNSGAAVGTRLHLVDGSTADVINADDSMQGAYGYAN